MSAAIELVVATLESRGLKPRKSGAGWESRCPAHGDSVASLSVNEGRDGRALIKCHAGCEVAAIVSALGLELKDLFQPSVNGGTYQETRYAIRDRAGKPVAFHIRRETQDGKKTFFWEREGVAGLKGVPVASLPLYGEHLLDDWPQDEPVIVCEGEKAATALVQRGFKALGTVCGASSCPSAQALAPLAGRPVILWPDQDAPGIAHMTRIAAHLSRMASSVHVYVWPSAQDHDDAHDYFAQGGTPQSLSIELAHVVTAQEWLLSLNPQQETASHPTLKLKPISVAELSQKTLTPIESFVDEAALPRGHVAMLHGKGGLGKSYLVVGLGICLATGTPWLGLPVRRARTLMITYEVPEQIAQMHAGEWCRALDTPQPDDFLIVTMEQLVTALLEPDEGEKHSAARDRLTALAQIHRADVLILDPWRSFHHAQEKDDTSMSRLMDSLKAVAAEARAAVLILHHERKSPPGTKDSEESSDSARGWGGMRDACRSVARLYSTKGSLCLEYHKVNLGSKPRPIWLNPQDHAPPQVAEPPEVESAKGKKNRLAQLTQFMRNNADGVTLAGIAAELEVAESTAHRYLLKELRDPVRNLRPLGETGLYVLGRG